MSEFNDPDLRRELGRLSGPYPDDNAAFAAWQRRVGQARRRRAVAWITCAAMTLIVATVGVAALQRPTRHSLVPGKSSETSALLTSTTPTTEKHESSTTESTAAPTSAPTTLAPDTTTSSVAEIATSLPEPEATDAAASPPSGGTTKVHASAPTSTEPDGAQSTTQTFDSGGGSITVRQDGNRLTVIGTAPADGFHADVDRHSGRDVEVKFRSGGHRFTIRVRLSDGVMKDHVSEDYDTRHDSVPDDTSGGGNPGGGGGGGGDGGGGGGYDRGGGA
jgi:hypothetical protein